MLPSGLREVARAERLNGKGLETARSQGLHVRGALIRVTVEARNDTAAAAAAGHRGGQGRGDNGTLVQALVPPGALERLARADAVDRVSVPRRPVQ